MAYADLLDDEGINSQYLVVMKPRRLISSTWTLSSGTIYTTTFSFTEIATSIIKVTDDGTELTEAASAAVGSNEWFYDADTAVLTVDVGADPTSSEIVVTYEIYLGTFDAHINRVPTDSSTRTVYFEPLITRSPSITQSTRDVLFGFLPTFSANLTVSNATHILQDHIHTSSFSKADFDLYHWLGDLENANIKKVLNGKCNIIKCNDRDITFSLLDASDSFNKEYRNPSAKNFFTTAAFPNLDPNFVNRPIRGLFGRVEGVVGVNIDYEAVAPTTSNNRNYICFSFRDVNDLNDFQTTVPASPSSTTTRTYVNDASGINVGDQVRNANKNETHIVTAVNKTGSAYFEHAAATAASTADVLDRKYISKVQILKEGVIYEPLFNRDWTTFTNVANNAGGFDFNGAMEGNLSISALTVNDKIWVTAYGEENFVELSASAFGSNSSNTSNLTDGVVILFQLIKDAGISESDINTSSFTTLQAAISDEISFMINERVNGDFPTYKQLITKIAQTLLLKIYQDDDLKWAVEQVGPVGAVDKTIEDDEILQGSFRYEFDYKDIISLAIVEYAFREVNNIGAGEFIKKAQSTSTLAQNLHGVEAQRTFSSLHFLDAQAATLADRLKYALGDRRGIVSFRTKNRFFDTELNDIIKITRDRLPGFPFVAGTDRSTDFAAIKTSKSLNEITVEGDDQKGIEDNSGSW